MNYVNADIVDIKPINVLLIETFMWRNSQFICCPLSLAFNQRNLNNKEIKTLKKQNKKWIKTRSRPSWGWCRCIPISTGLLAPLPGSARSSSCRHSLQSPVSKNVTCCHCLARVIYWLIDGWVNWWMDKLIGWWMNSPNCHSPGWKCLGKLPTF